MPTARSKGSRPSTNVSIARSHSAGFTLLEIIVALTVLGLMMAGLAQGLRAGVAAWMTQTRAMNSRADVDAVDRTLRSLTARMDPGGVSGRPPLLKATSRSLTFTTTLPEAADNLPSRVADATLAVSPAHQLELLWTPHGYGVLGRTQQPERVVLLDHVDRLEMSYWDDPKIGWQPNWRGVTLPKLIRFRVVLSPGAGRIVPDVVVAPMRDRWRL